MALSPDGKLLVTANTGTWPFSLSIISGLASNAPDVQQIPPGYPLKHSDVEPSSVYMGLAIAGDNRTAYVSEGDTGKIDAYDLQLGQRSQVISLDHEFNGRNYRHSFSGALALSPDGKLLYALDLAHFELVVIETRSGTIRWRVEVGRLPFAVAVSPGGDHIYVSNVGTFRYSVVPGFDVEQARETGLDFPPFATGTPEAEKGVIIAGDHTISHHEADGVIHYVTNKSRQECGGVWGLETCELLGNELHSKCSEADAKGGSEN